MLFDVMCFCNDLSFVGLFYFQYAHSWWACSKMLIDE